MRDLVFVKSKTLEWRDAPDAKLLSATDVVVRPFVAARCDEKRRTSAPHTTTSATDSCHLVPKLLAVRARPDIQVCFGMRRQRRFRCGRCT
jgi:hypothetical protein